MSTYPHQLFPHHWAAIVADQVPSQRPEWITLKYKIQASELDRLYFAPDKLVGVRFGSETKYALLDIDKCSPYHPAISKTEWDRLLLVLEEVGLTDRLIIQSSFSGGLHIYYWFPEALPTFAVAQLLWATLVSKGFHLRGGDLELFPNPKVYTPVPSLYTAHRLPLQPNTGSVLLDEHLDEILEVDQRSYFFGRANNPQQDLDLLNKKIKWAGKYFKKHRLGQSGMGNTAAEWQRCLDERLELGWTDEGQTNEILRSICVRAWVFSYSDDIDLLHQKILRIPGYTDHCQHQEEILERLRDWMDCVKRRYYPYGRPDLAPDRGAEHSLLAVPAERERPKSTARQDEVLARLKGVVKEITESAIEVPKKIGDLIGLIQKTAKEIHGKAFGISTLYNYKYEPEWRILVKEAQSQTQQEILHINEYSEIKKKKTSNSVSLKLLLDFSLMKVLFFLRSFLSSADGSEIFSDSLTEEFSEPQNFDRQPDELSQELISFTNRLFAGARSETPIKQTYESEDWRAIDLTLEDDDEPVVRIGDFLRRVPTKIGGRFYPELIAKVVTEGYLSWELLCAEGKSWRCPYNMLGIGWELVARSP